MRVGEIKRKTKETNIDLSLNLDGSGKIEIDTGIGFFDHMLDLMCRHGFLDMKLKCVGDLQVDNHHTVEDIGIVFGKALKKALGDKKGITRYATIFTPMDEAMSMISIDISGRAYLHFDVTFEREYVGQFETELVEEFFRAFVNHAAITLHISLKYGKNTHHLIESIFKGLGRVLDEATRVQDRIEGVLSTKGSL
ncbi:imidazoleglycerol-phosphate dehydratase HisB [Crassaminicella profunda]|uniref:imidazoleglycerol-phosphate dehydratase HisB n=1 Tax=Crassaminicella profunda TaxID=1286698 RepID=UPI001CA73155|nr:imidazoleglycerol-phosphate dehydratase HisB [Crassaminicella profunda]QZY57237.1 imidazoleglycerol-phosphate dehydratase HisB [Crassaminicella profunda]